MTTLHIPRPSTIARPLGRSQTHRFIRHFFEMLIAMIAGMLVLGAIVSLIFALLGHGDLLHYAALRALLMATYMTLGMSLWMRYRGHALARIREMAVAMFAPFIVLLVPYGMGIVSAGALLVGGHVLMLVCMIGVMLYRRDEYSQGHGGHGDHSAHLAER